MRVGIPIMVEMPVMEQTESDAFLRRIASCTTSEEARMVIAEVEALYVNEKEANNGDR